MAYYIGSEVEVGTNDGGKYRGILYVVDEAGGRITLDNG